MGNRESRRSNRYFDGEELTPSARERGSARKSRRSKGFTKDQDPFLSNERKSSGTNNGQQLNPLLGIRPGSRRDERPGSRRASDRASSNRYEGLGDINIVTATQRRRGAASSQRSNSYVAFVKNNEEIVLDLNKSPEEVEEDLPPPPPPLEDATVYKKPEPSGKLTKDDMTFIDYTVVPLLLRADLDYTLADKFGNRLKRKYKRAEIDAFMSNPMALFNAMDTENIEISEDVKFNVIEDKFWNNGVEPKGRNRNSFVYYKETPTNVSRVSKRSARSSYRERASMKLEFDQQQSLNKRSKDHDVDIMGSLAQSLIQLEEELKQEEEEAMMKVL